MKKYCAILLSTMAGFLLITLLSPSLHAFELGARGSYWFPTFKSDARVDGSSIRGTEFNFEDNLGVDADPFPGIEIFAGLGKNHISLMYTQGDSSAATTLSQAITFNGTTFPAGTAVNSEFKLKMLDLTYKRDLIDTRNILAGFAISAMGKIKYLEGDMNISSGANRASESIKVPIPMVGLGAHVGILADILEARVEIAGIGYSSNYLFEALADLSFTPFPFLDIHGGYKTINLHVDQDDVFLDAQFSGPYAALTVSF